MQLQKLKLQHYLARLEMGRIKINETEQIQVIGRNYKLIYQVGDSYFESRNAGKKP